MALSLVASSQSQAEAEPTTPVNPRAAPRYIVERIAKQYAHPDYLAFQNQLGAGKVPLASPNAGLAGFRSQFSVWDLINDAVDGTGGFVDGSYLIPHELELGGMVPGNFTNKFRERQQLARYDKFPKVICDGPWNSIISMKDVIQRDAQSHPRLEEFWDSVDGNNTSILDFLEYPVSQARRFGTGWIFLDRQRDIQNLKDDLAAQPWAYSVPTRNVVWWEFSRYGALDAVAYRDPGPDDPMTYDEKTLSPLMVWTTRSWSRWVPTGESDVPYRLDAGRSGPNRLGRVPAVLIYDEWPGCGKALGKSSMLSTARDGMDIFNRDSEIREIERRCAFPVLGVNMEDTSAAGEIKIGTNGALIYDGKVPPGYIEPVLNSIDKLQSERKAVKEASYTNSEMAGLIGHAGTVETSSGFHAEVELDKSERKIGRFASSVETAENKIASLFLELIGESDEEYSVSYPRRFGLMDPEKVIDRTVKRLNMGLGQMDQKEVLLDYYASMYPRRTKEEIEGLANAAVAEKVQRLADEQKAEQDAARQLTARGRLMMAAGKVGA